MARDLVIGVDAGGTATRCAVATRRGAVVGYGTAGGANQRSSGGDPASNLSAALRAALSDVDPRRVARGVVGVAGAAGAGATAAQEAAGRAWRAADLAGGPEVVTDIVVAFAGATPAIEGAVLVAGTGAVAAAVRNDAVVRRCDGYGWWLGDEGSAVWLGHAAVRAALAATDGRGKPTALVTEVPRALLGAASPDDGGSPDDLGQAIIAAVHARPPAALGELAPVLAAAAEGGDVVAGHLVADGAARLLAAIDAVLSAFGEPAARDRRIPVAVAGSVLRSGPVADIVLAGLRERLAAEPLRTRDGALGAAAIALRRLGGDTAEAHRALLEAAQTGLPERTLRGRQA